MLVINFDGFNLKRSTGKLSPAEVFSLLTLMDSRDPYRPLSPLPEYISDDQANDVLAYAPNGMYPDVALPLALEQLLGARGGGGAGGDGYAYDDAGEWMNGWTEPSVDYMGIPMTDLDALAYMPQKRFMVSKKKRSVTQAPSPAAVVGCNPGDASCGAQSHQQGGIIQAAA
uniref:Uncharacterized protein n=1 Tax=Anopheles melas TaxID=34690 RepID=A0A182U519_9DIPT